MTTQREARSTSIRDPGEANRIGLDVAEKLHRNSKYAIRLGLGRAFDEYFVPPLAGDLVSVVGMTSNLKSGLMQFCARQVAGQLKDQNRDGECVVYASWEQSIEAMVMLDFARSCGFDVSDFPFGRVQCWDDVKRAAVKDSAVPIYRFGHSSLDAVRSARKTLPSLQADLVRLYDDIGLRPAVIFLDYLQALDTQTGGNDERRLEVRENVYRAKELAVAMKCPVILGVQAKQSLMERDDKIPGCTTARKLRRSASAATPCSASGS